MLGTMTTAQRRGPAASTHQPSIARVAIIAACGALAFGIRGPLDAWQQAGGTCRIVGRAVSGTQPLPGASALAKSSGSVKTATSRDPDGTYRIMLPEGTYDLAAELTGFTSISRSVTVGGGACDQTIDLPLTLAPRTPSASQTGSSAAPGSPSGRRGMPSQGSGAAAQNGAAAGQRFETLNVQTQAASAAAATESTDAGDAAARLLLPPGFSTEGPTEAVAINGNMASLDRGMMNDRLDAIGRGEFNPATGEFAQGFGPGGRGDGQGFGGPGGRGGPGGFGGRGGPGGPGGPGGRGDFVLGGRGRGQNAYNAQTNYTFGGSALDTAPYQLHP